MSDLDEEFARIGEAINEGKANFSEDEQNIIDSWISKLSEPKETDEEKQIRNEYARTLDRLVNKEKHLREPFLFAAPDGDLTPLEQSAKYKIRKMPCPRPKSGQGTGAVRKTKKPDRSLSSFQSYASNKFEDPEEMAKVVARSKGQSFAGFVKSISRHTADCGQELVAAMKTEVNSFKDYVDHVLSQRIKDLTEVLDEEQNRELQRIKKDIEGWQFELSNVKKRIREMVPDFDFDLFKKDKNYIKSIMTIDVSSTAGDDSFKKWMDESCHRLKRISDMTKKTACCNEQILQEIARIKAETLDLDNKESVKQQCHIKRINCEISEFQKLKLERDKLYKEIKLLSSQLQEIDH